MAFTDPISAELNPSGIMQVGLGFWASKVLLSAVELGLFTHLSSGPLTGEEIGRRLKLHPRGIWDFLDALVALKFLDRDGSGKGGKYRNTPETALFLDRGSPHYIGGILEMANARLYRFWGGLTEGLQTGQPQNETAHGEEQVFDVLYSDPAKLEQFLAAMAGISKGNFRSFADKFDFSRYQTLCDVGGATGQLAIAVANRHPHMHCISFDLPVVEPIAERVIRAAGVSDRVTTARGSFFEDPLPRADVITMGMILHDWNLQKKKFLIQAAYDALPPGGALVAIENIIDDERRENAFGILMSLNMLIEFGEAFDFTGSDFSDWCKEAGFQRTQIIPLGGPASAAVAYK
ncbi:MAG: methyltransferase [Bdellovibrionota bacterium]